MSYLRAGYRLVALIAVQIIFTLLGVILFILFSRSKKKHWSCIALFMGYWARCCCFILNIHVKVSGEEKPAGKTLIVSNHVGLSDIFILGSCFAPMFVSKQDVRHWPLVGWMVRLGGAVFVDRSKRHQVPEMISMIAERLEMGFPVALFPEGGITDGKQVGSFKSSSFEAAVKSRATVVPVMIRYHDDNNPSVAFWGGTTFLNHIVRLMKNPRLDATLTLLPAIREEKDRRVIAKHCEEMIGKAYMDQTKKQNE